MLNYLRMYTTVISCVYIIYVYAHASSASRPPTGRTILTSPSLALTNGSAFGELFILVLPPTTYNFFRLMFITFVRTYLRTYVPYYLLYYSGRST